MLAPSLQRSARAAARRPRTARPRRPSPAAARRPRFVPAPTPPTPPLPHPLRMGGASLKRATLVGPHRTSRKAEKRNGASTGREREKGAGEETKSGELGSFTVLFCSPHNNVLNYSAQFLTPKGKDLNLGVGGQESWVSPYLVPNVQRDAVSVSVSEYLGWA